MTACRQQRTLPAPLSKIASIANLASGPETASAGRLCQGHLGTGQEAIAHLKVHTPALWMSKALNEVDGRFSATHSSALRMDLCVTTRCCVPSASRISA